MSLGMDSAAPVSQQFDVQISESATSSKSTDKLYYRLKFRLWFNAWGLEVFKKGLVDGNCWRGDVQSVSGISR